MRLLVCGGRDYYNKARVFETLDRIHKVKGIDSIVEGGQTGADSISAEWAFANGVDLAECQANWKKHKGYAGPKRNKFMSTLNIDGAVAFGGGKGTAGMIKILEEKGIKVMEVDRNHSDIEG